MSEFAEKIKEFKIKSQNKLLSVFRQSCAQISLDIAEATPVSTGRLLGSWSPSKNGANAVSFMGGPTAWVNGQKDGAIASQNRGVALPLVLSSVEAITSSLTTEDEYYFTNSTPYALQAEHDGWERTGPYHMTTNAKQNWNLIVKSKAAILK